MFIAFGEAAKSTFISRELQKVASGKFSVTSRATSRMPREKLRENIIDKESSLTCNSLTNSSAPLYSFPIMLLHSRFLTLYRVIPSESRF